MSGRPVSGDLASRAARSGNERFVASRSVAPANRVAFASRMSASQASGNYGSVAGFNRSVTPPNAAVRVPGQSAAGSAPRPSPQNGWPRAGNEANAGSGTGRVRSPSIAGTGSSQSSSNPGSNPARGGWSSFGTPAGVRTASGDNALATRSSGQASATSQRGGWTSFGSPERSTASTTQPGRGTWSTGGGTAGGGGYSRYESPSPRSNSGSDRWSSGGGQPGRGTWNSGGSSSPRYSAPARESAPHYSSGGGASRQSGGGASRQSAPAPSRSGGGGGGGGHSGGGHAPHR